MDSFGYLAGALAEVAQPINLLCVFAGTLLGVLVGALPGLSSPTAIIVLLPLTYSMPTLPALLIMMGVYVGTKLGGAFPAILLRTPGTPAGACTALDGYPMAMRGEAGRALGYATFGSTCGGVVGWVMAVLFVPLIASIAIRSSSADVALVGTLGLILVSAFVREAMIKGLLAVALGALLGTVGLDPIEASERFTFGYYQLLEGIPFAAALIGFFGVAVVLTDLGLVGRTSELVADKVALTLPSLRDMAKRWRAVLIGSVYGTGVGAIPGVGAEGATWLAYATVKNASKNKDAFGRGEPDGIVAPEATNNAVTGGTMVPMLTLGIPGDASTAVMLGALTLHGVEPGVLLMREDPQTLYGLLAGLLFSTLFMFLIALVAIRLFVVVLQRDRGWIFPFVLVFSIVGAFATANDTFPIWVAIATGLLGWAFEKLGFPAVCIVLGLILGPIVEYNARLALALSGGEWSTFVATWPRIVMVGIILVLLGAELLAFVRPKGKKAAQNAAETP
jgi:putative tricarboxylic transport membrane protein